MINLAFNQYNHMYINNYIASSPVVIDCLDDFDLNDNTKNVYFQLIGANTDTITYQYAKEVTDYDTYTVSVISVERDDFYYYYVVLPSSDTFSDTELKSIPYSTYDSSKYIIRLFGMYSVSSNQYALAVPSNFPVATASNLWPYVYSTANGLGISSSDSLARFSSFFATPTHYLSPSSSIYYDYSILGRDYTYYSLVTVNGLLAYYRMTDTSTATVINSTGVSFLYEFGNHLVNYSSTVYDILGINIGGNKFYVLLISSFAVFAGITVVKWLI